MVTSELVATFTHDSGLVTLRKAAGKPLKAEEEVEKRKNTFLLFTLKFSALPSICFGKKGQSSLFLPPLDNLFPLS